MQCSRKNPHVGMDTAVTIQYENEYSAMEDVFMGMIAAQLLEY